MSDVRGEHSDFDRYCNEHDIQQGEEPHYLEVTVEIKDKVTGDVTRVSMPHVASWSMGADDELADWWFSPRDTIVQLQRADLVLSFDARKQDNEFVYEMRMIRA